MATKEQHYKAASEIYNWMRHEKYDLIDGIEITKMVVKMITIAVNQLEIEKENKEEETK